MTEGIVVGPKIREIQEFMRTFFAANGYSPTYREIGEAVGVKSTQTIHRLVHVMMDDGVVTLVRGRSRTLRLVDNDSDRVIGSGRRIE